MMLPTLRKVLQERPVRKGTEARWVRQDLLAHRDLLDLDGTLKETT